MPAMVGIRELKNQASRILRAVREGRQEYIITLQGRPVAILRPFTEADAQKMQTQELQTALAEMQSLAQEVSDVWQSSQGGVALVGEQRR